MIMSGYILVVQNFGKLCFRPEAICLTGNHWTGLGDVSNFLDILREFTMIVTVRSTEPCLITIYTCDPTKFLIAETDCNIMSHDEIECGD